MDKLVNDEKKGKKEQHRITFEIAKEVEGGVYANQVIIGHSYKEFIVDFGLLIPPGNKIKIVSRIITNPVDAKLFVKALSENIALYEKKFGEIRIPKVQTPPPDHHQLH
ncbi:MAG: DUF3467 domain-containing protein [bacterium]